MKTYDARNIVVKVGETVVTGLGEAIMYRYARGAVPYPVLTAATGARIQDVKAALILVPNDKDDLSFMRYESIHCTGRRVPPSTWDPKKDHDLANTLAVVDQLRSAIDAGDEGALAVARDVALDAGWVLEVISDGQAEADRLASARTPTIMWRKEGDAEARCGGLRFIHPNAGGPLAPWTIARIARMWTGKPLYRYRRRDGQITDKANVWEPKQHDAFGQAPFSEKPRMAAVNPTGCGIAGCTNYADGHGGLCIAHETRPWEEGDREW